jgi:Asp-tRNA(Asn)/Glu-tRNA(Gln) amidotransferase A subunit family amidase
MAVTRAPHELSAAAAAAAIRAGRLTSLELVDACLARIAEREPEVRAWQSLDADAARAAARRRDAEPPRGPLHGVPIGVKDIIDTADLPTGYGTPIYAGHRPQRDAACVALALRAGAVLLGKTVSTELAYFTPGPTRNPRRATHTPGGSSSGSAAAVADRMVALAFGTQTAGSITRPASFCGVVGYKPTFGALPMDGIKPFAPTLDTLGVLTRDVDDVALLRAALLGEAFVPFAQARPLPRIGLCRTPWWSAADASTRDGIEACVARLARRGAPVTDVALPASCDSLVEVQRTVMAYEAARSLAVEHAQHRSRLGAPLVELLDTGARLSPDEHRRALAVAAQARRDVASLFVGCDVLLAPAAIGEAPAGLAATGDPLFARAWTLLGPPTVTLPAFTGPSGLPVGVQLIGAHGDDARLLAAAHALAVALGPAA